MRFAQKSFQFTPLREGRRNCGKAGYVRWNFNSRPSARGDNIVANVCRQSCYFNSRPSARGDLSGGFYFVPPLISIHAPPRGATLWQSTVRHGMIYFNSRPSARGDESSEISAPCWDISIHAPPRGATRHTHLHSCIGYISIHAPPRGATDCRGARRQLRYISIHAPPRGATWHHAFYRMFCGHFNSRPSARGDGVLRDALTACLISIHAPPRGATFLLSLVRPSSTISIHAPPRGATRIACGATAQAEHFNSRPSARGDSTRFLCFAHQFYFNSRPSARGDDNRRHASGQSRISIHAPPRGATRRQPLVLVALQISIHAPPRGATTEGKSVSGMSPHFNSRPSARGDSSPVTLGMASCISIHAPPRGATQTYIGYAWYEGISIHAPPRGATFTAFVGDTGISFQFTPLREGRLRHVSASLMQ